MESATLVQILDEAVFISQSADTLEKDMNWTIPPPIMDKQLGRLGSLSLVWQQV